MCHHFKSNQGSNLSFQGALKTFALCHYLNPHNRSESVFEDASL